MSIAHIIDGVIARESPRFTNDPRDSGGPTKFGITLSTLAAYRKVSVTAADVEELKRDEAVAIYRWKYIEQPKFNLLIPISEVIAEKVIDTGVLCGQQRSAEWLQRLLNALNRQGKDYQDISVDGDCGNQTVVALKAYLAKRGADGPLVFLEGLRDLQGAFLIGLAEKRSKDEDFLFGWIKNRVAIGAH